MTQAPAPEGRRSLSLTPTTRHGSRSYMTCHYRCGDACDKPEPNVSGHTHIRDVVGTALQRRALVKGAAVGTGALVLGVAAGSASPVAAEPAVGSKPKGKLPKNELATVDFTPVRPNRRDAVTTPRGFEHDVVIGWGDPVVAGAPDFDVRAQTVEAARTQFGYNCDYVGVLPLKDVKNDRRDRSLLVVNHEYTNDELMYPADTYDDVTRTALSMSYVGMSVVQIKRGLQPGNWRVDGNLEKATHNRRIHIDTEFRVAGPAAGDDRLKTTEDPTGRLVKGTMNNCAGGTTPWGTVLSGEENFNFYFDLPEGETLDERYAAEYARYGITGAGSGWSAVQDRFDLSVEPHEPHRFGWVVELDPYEPDSRPVKQTMLGRFKHEGANISEAADGRAVAYMGDDERGDYVYKFVSRKKINKKNNKAARRKNKRLLQQGTLYVARFTGDGTEDGVYDGTGEWIPLCSDTESFVEGMSVADVLLFTRLAADKVSPTRMDRPEDIEPNPVNGKVYCALTNNSQRGSRFEPDEANPLTSSMVRPAIGAPLTEASGNRNGYVLEISPTGDDHAADTFAWDLMLVCGDPEAPETYFAGFDKAQVSPISCPDNVAFDELGNLWVSTDGNALGSNDGIFRVPVTGKDRGKVEQFVTMPRGAEACGPLLVEDRSLFFAVQHPGEIDGATFENQLGTWPHTHDYPRPAVCVAYRNR